MAYIARGGAPAPYNPPFTPSRGGGNQSPYPVAPRAPVLSEPMDARSRQMFARNTAGFGGYAKGSTQAEQAFLKARGFYSGPISGARGPAMLAAIAAFKNRGTAGSGGAHQPVLPGGGGGGGLTRGGGAGGGGGGGGLGGGGRGRSGGGAGGGSNFSLGNPAKVAKAMTAMQYGGVLSALQTNIKNLVAQNAQNQSDIQSWFGNAQDAQGAATTADLAAAGHAVNENQSQLAGLLQAVGGHSIASDPLAAMGASDSTLLQALGQAQGGYDQNMKAQIAASMAGALTASRNSGDTAVQNLRDQLHNDLLQRGNAQIVNLSNAKQQQLQQMAELQNMSLANQQFGLNQKLGLADLMNKNLVNKSLAKSGSGGGAGSFGSLQAGDRLKLQQAITPRMWSVDANNRPVTTARPNIAWVQAANQLRSLGYNVQTNPQARKWLSSVWANYVMQYNQQHPNSKYTPAANGTPFANWNS